MSNIEKENNDSGLQKFSNFVIFQTADGKVNIDVFFKDKIPLIKTIKLCLTVQQ